MAEYRSTDPHGQLLAGHDQRATIWTTETTADEREPYPGRVVPGTTSDVRLTATGDQETSDTIQFKALRAGGAGAGLELGWKKTADTLYSGYNQPTVPTHAESVYYTASTAAADRLENPRAVVLDDFRILVSWNNHAAAYTASTKPNYHYAVRDTSGTWSAPSAVYGGGGGEIPTFPGCQGLASCPLVMRDEAGTVLLYTVTHENVQDTEVAQVAVVRSTQASLDFTADPQGLVAANTSCLPDGVVCSSGDTFALAVAEYGGQVCLLLQQDQTVRQYASTDGGYTFAFVSEMTGVFEATIDLAVVQGVFVMSCGEAVSVIASVIVRRIGSATDSFADAGDIVVATLSGGTCGPTRMVVSDDERLWLYSSRVLTNTRISVFLSEEAGGEGTWQEIQTNSGVNEGARVISGDGSAWDTQNPNSTGDAPFCMTWHRGRAVVIGRQTGGGAAVNCYGAWYFGGFADLVMPYRDRFRARIRRASWADLWLPVCALSTVYTQTIVGTVTQTFNSTVGITIDVSAASSAAFEKRTAVSLSGGGVAAIGVAAWVTTGTVYYQLRTTNASNYYLVEIEHTATKLEVFGGTYTAGTSYGSASVSGMIEIVAWMSGPEVSVYYRTFAEDDTSKWTYLGGSAAVPTTAGPTFPQTVGVNVTASTQLRMRYFGATTYESISTILHTSMGVGITPGGSSTRENPIGIPAGNAPNYIVDGVYLAASGGPAHLNETWEVSPTSQWALERAACDATYPSPRTDAQTATATDGAILAYQFGSEAESRIYSAWVVVIQGNVPGAAFSWHDGTSWGSDTTLTRHVEISGIREGAIVYATTTAASTVQYVDKDELVGGYVDMGSGDVRKIVSNTAGAIVIPTGKAVAAAKILVEGIDTTEATSGTWRIVFYRTVHILPDSQAKKKGYRIKLYTTTGGGNAPPEGRYEFSILAGPAWPIPWQHGQDTVRVHRPRVSISEAPDGTARFHRMGEPEEVVELHWEAGPRNMQDWYIDAADGDYFGAGTSGDKDAAVGETLSSLRALVDDHGSTGAPLVYVAQYDRDDIGVGTPVHLLRHRNMGCVVGQVLGEWRTQHAGHGNEMYSELVRGGTLRLRSL